MLLALSPTTVQIAYVVSAVLFILGLKGLTRPRTAVRGNMLGAMAMLLAIVVTLLDREVISFGWILVGIAIGSAAGAVLAQRIEMTAMPQLVALFNGLGGGASTLVAGAYLAGSKHGEAVTAGIGDEAYRRLQA